MSISPTPFHPSFGDNRPIEDILAEIRAYAAAAAPADRMNWYPNVADLATLEASADPSTGFEFDPNLVPSAHRGDYGADAANDTGPPHPVMRAEAVDLPSVLRRATPVKRAPAASVHPFPRPMRKLTEALRAVQPAPAISTPHAAAAPAKPAEDSETPRRMTSFLDTRFKTLTQPAPQPAQAETAPVESAPQEAPTFADLDAALGGNRAAIAKVLGREGAAEILRPMLKQWLLENMPRIVEQVLTLEMPENALKTVHKTRR